MIFYVCPWWAARFTIDTPFRRLIHDPQKIVGPFVAPGMTVLDVGCGVGWFSIPIATMVGDSGRVIAVDLQQPMLDIVRRRAEKANVAARIQTHLCQKNRLGIDASVDFILLFAMLHEVPDSERMLRELRDCLKEDGKLLLAEPPIHVTGKRFASEVAAAKNAGFQVVDQPNVRWARAVLLQRS